MTMRKFVKWRADISIIINSFDNVNEKVLSLKINNLKENYFLLKLIKLNIVRRRIEYAEFFIDSKSSILLISKLQFIHLFSQKKVFNF